MLGGRDLLRDEHGTWLGITRQGRIAVLVNFHENQTPVETARSRGAIVNAWLKLPPESRETIDEFIRDYVSDDAVKDVGGFSILLGQLRNSKADDVGCRINSLAVVSNRSKTAGKPIWITGSPGEAHGMSNSAIDDPWPKVHKGCALLDEAITKSVYLQEAEDDLLKRLFAVLSVNDLPAPDPGEPFESYLGKSRHSIFIPAFKVPVAVPVTPSASASTSNAESNIRYGTQAQTVILVDSHFRVKFVERTLYGDGEQTLGPLVPGDLRFTFDLQGWEE